MNQFTKPIVVIPTYNEATNLPALVCELWQLGVAGLEILVVDDASPDGTGELALQLAAAHPGRIHVLQRSGKLGLGTAYVQGFRQALQLGADAIIQMDADFSHSPCYIPEFLAALGDWDVVVGSRYVWQGKLDQRWGRDRLLLSWWANAVYTRLLLNIHVNDATAGFKCWRREALLGIDLNRIGANGYVFMVEMAYVTERLGYRVKEMPIYFQERQRGQSKMSMRIKLEAAWRVWEVRWRHHGLTPGCRAFSV
jgi:dolichol-phosphate mannosyltransferase